jgi:hypothetical protein
MKLPNRQRILAALAQNGRRLCDGCLTVKVGLPTRQIAWQICTDLAAGGEIERARRVVCEGCYRTKICNRWDAQRVPESASPSETRQSATERRWFWEGNVQARLVDWLRQEGWLICSTADTAAKTPGVDIIAKRDLSELWVSVKGYPEKSAPVQAGHWFAGAIFDLVRYRSRRPDLDLAIALPDEFTRYLNLAPQVMWLRQAMPFRIFWIRQDGTLRSE